MITIDSQIWIYYFDPNAPENANATQWMETKLISEEIALSAIIPLEVAHNLYSIPKFPLDQIERLIFRWITQKNIKILEISQKEMIYSLQLLKTYRSRGIGGRDCLILATMDPCNVDILVTHDKNLLKLDRFTRIDPVSNPPMVLKKVEGSG